MIRLLLIHSYLFASLWHGIANQLPTTPLDDCRTWAYNHSTIVTDCPDSLWNRLEVTVQDSILSYYADE